MTYKEFFKFKDLETESAIRGYLKKKDWWCDHFIDDIRIHLQSKVSNFEIFCDYPFWKLNKIYNSYYNKDNRIGTIYDWLEDDTPEDIVKKYLGKENE